MIQRRWGRIHHALRDLCDRIFCILKPCPGRRPGEAAEKFLALCALVSFYLEGAIPRLFNEIVGFVKNSLYFL
jgi:hypothetical protein